MQIHTAANCFELIIEIQLNLQLKNIKILTELGIWAGIKNKRGK